MSTRSITRKAKPAATPTRPPRQLWLDYTPREHRLPPEALERFALRLAAVGYRYLRDAKCAAEDGHHRKAAALRREGEGKIAAAQDMLEAAADQAARAKEVRS